MTFCLPLVAASFPALFGTFNISVLPDITDHLPQRLNRGIDAGKLCARASDFTQLIGSIEFVVQKSSRSWAGTAETGQNGLGYLTRPALVAGASAQFYLGEVAQRRMGGLFMRDGAKRFQRRGYCSAVPVEYFLVRGSEPDSVSAFRGRTLKIFIVPPFKYAIDRPCPCLGGVCYGCALTVRELKREFRALPSLGQSGLR